jgi:hypothetical protein
MENATLQLILNEQQRIGTSMAELALSVNAHNVENARLPDKIRLVVREEMKECPAYIHFDELDRRTNDVTGVVRVHEERIRAAQERIARNSRGPRNKAPWWAPTFAKVIAAFALLLTTSGLGAWGVHCSSASKQPHSQQASK